MLRAYVDGANEIEGMCQGQVRRQSDGPALLQADELSDATDPRLLQRWVAGVAVDWNRLYGATKPPRVELPTYPFAREKHWLDKVAGRAPAVGPATSGALRPARVNMQSVDDILDRIDAASLDAAEGVQLLKELL